MEAWRPSEGQKVWACAYETSNTEKSLSLKRTPVYGIVRGREFYELKKDGEPKSKGVYIYSRKYADTKEESIAIYNGLIDNQITFLHSLIRNCEKDRIF